MGSDGVSASGAGRPAAMRIAVLALAVLAGVAAIAAIWYGISWARAEHDSDLELAETRDVVLRDAGQAAVNLNTLDHQRVEQALDLWERSSTGEVLEDFRTNRQRYADYIETSERRTAATVVDSAVAELDTGDGRARVLLVLEIVATSEGQEPSTSRQRLDMELQRTGQGWKVSSVGSTGSAGAAPPAPTSPSSAPSPTGGPR